MRLFRIALPASLLLLPAIAAAQPDFGYIDELVARYIESFNSGDEERMLAFFKEYGVPPTEPDKNEERRRRLYRVLKEELGTIEAETIEVSQGEVEVVIRASDGRPRRLIFLLDGSQDHKIQGISLRMGEDTGQGSLPPIEMSSGADRTRAFDGYLSALAAEERFSGTALVARGDEVLFEGAYGLASREYRVANTIDTRFDVGSITKLFTKVAIAQLAEKGTLSLDDTILDHLPHYPDTEIARKITLQHLLDHTSGLGDIFTDRFSGASKARFRHTIDFFPLFTGEPLLFEPGEGQSYSNAGYIVLGAIIESAAGMPYEKVIRDRVFGPAGMTDSAFLARDVPAPRRATGYTAGGHGGPDGKGLRSNIFMMPPNGCPAGSSVSSVRDLWRFDRALRSGKLLGPQWTVWFFTGSLESSGTEVGDLSLGFAGGGPGVSAVLEIGGDVIVTVLANMDPPIASQIARRLMEASAGERR